MAGSDASEGQAVWQPGGAEEDSRLREGNRHLHLAYDEGEEITVQDLDSKYQTSACSKFGTVDTGADKVCGRMLNECLWNRRLQTSTNSFPGYVFSTDLHLHKETGMAWSEFTLWNWKRSEAALWLRTSQHLGLSSSPCETNHC